VVSGWLLAAVRRSPFLTGAVTLPPSSRPTGMARLGAGVGHGHGPAAIAGLADGIEGLADGEIALGDGADFGDGHVGSGTMSGLP
jgi:hypothetical protein